MSQFLIRRTFGFAVALLLLVTSIGKAFAASEASSPLDWQKIRLEQILLERMTKVISPLLPPEKYVLTVRVNYFVPTKKNKPQSSRSLALDDTAVLDRLGLEVDSYNDPDMDIFKFLKGIEVSVSLDKSVSEAKAKTITSNIEAVVSGFSNIKPKINLQRLDLVEPPPLKTFLEELAEKIKEFQVPLSTALLIAGALALLMLQKKVPTWNDVTKHKIDLEQAKKKENESKANAAKRAKEEEDKKKLEAESNKPASITDIAEFRLNRELTRRLTEMLSKIDTNIVNTLVENWFLEGEIGLKKCVLLARAWNDVRPDENIRIEATPEVISLFKNIAKTSYAERNRILDFILHEVVGISSMGILAFRDRFGFLLAKSKKVQLEAIKFLKEPSERAILLGNLPATRQGEILEEIDLSEKAEVIYAAMGITQIPDGDIEKIAKAIRTNLSKIEASAGSNAGTKDLSGQRVNFLEALAPEEEMDIVSRMQEWNPFIADWLKAHYWGLSMLPSMKDSALLEITNRIDNELLLNILLVFSDEFAQRTLALQGALKSAIVGDMLKKARKTEQKPEWSEMKAWVAEVREAYRNKKGFKPQDLYENFDKERSSDKTLISHDQEKLGYRSTSAQGHDGGEHVGHDESAHHNGEETAIHEMPTSRNRNNVQPAEDVEVAMHEESHDDMNHEGQNETEILSEDNSDIDPNAFVDAVNEDNNGEGGNEGDGEAA